MGEIRVLDKQIAELRNLLGAGYDGTHRGAHTYDHQNGYYQKVDRLYTLNHNMLDFSVW